jgi:TonB dependent receptor/Carboxypeptidase regulatory-like domain
MQPRQTLWRIASALVLLVVLLSQVTWALAGVTGTLNGTVVIEGTNAPVAQAKVTVSSASQTSTTTTDNSGHFGFVSLVPDTYTLTVSKEGAIESIVQRGVTVLSDQVGNLVLLAKPYIKTLASVTSRASSDLVRPGTTANVYAVNAAAQARTASFGGGGSADQGYSALAALPGSYIAPNQAGWYQVVNIRGGDYDQVGYEFDGVPVNRSFDNYPTTNLSAIGQQELQIYTGAESASSEGEGLSGYINQVIKAGTYPGYGTLTLAVGAPNLYNKASLEVGGASPNRNFSYYVGLGLIDYTTRYYDNNQGASQISTYGTPYDVQNDGAKCTSPTASNFTPCYANGANVIFGIPAGPGGYYLGNLAYLQPASIVDRENVFNFHFGIPHHHDSGKDDVQLLYDSFLVYNYYATSPSDWGRSRSFFAGNANGILSGNAQPFVISGLQYNGPVGQVFAAADPTQAGNVQQYAFPSEGTAGYFGVPINPNKRDGYDNGIGIYKAQYQRNIGTSSYLRVYGYSLYSWWFIHGENAAFNNFATLTPDYELWSHTRGGSVQYVNQLSPHHLLNIEGLYSTASTVRDNNTQMFNSVSGARGDAAQLVSAANPTSGICYNVADPGVPSSCLKASRNTPGGGDYLSFGPLTCGANCPASIGGLIVGGGLIPGSGIPAPSTTACGGPCAWYLSENGPYATYNTVTPRYWAVSLQDTWKPTDRLNLNLGIRENIYTFGFSPTGLGTRQFWFKAWNAVECVNPSFNNGNPVDETTLGFQAGTSCSAVSTTGFPAGSFAPATLTNSTENGGGVTYSEFEPRIGGTYTFGTDDVLRFSAGRYSQPANAAYQQYNSLDQDLPEHLLGPLFYRFGFKTPDHHVTPSISYNYDVSLEHHFAKTDASFRLTPFLRQTRDQVQQLYIDPATAFVSGLNVGNETNYGFEFMLQSGDFNRNGWGAQLSYTYTHSLIKYSALPNGGTVLDLDNVDIQKYNSFTSACVGATPSTNPTSLCGVSGSQNAVATEGSGIANPYFNAPAQSRLDPNGQYAPFDIVPVGVQLYSESYVVPHVASLVVQYKANKWSFVPAVQFHAGGKYGAPETTNGFDPSTCPKNLGALAPSDPRYPFGGTGNAADATSCSGSLVIPDPFTGKFDAVGAFTEPSELNVHFGINYDATQRVSYRLNLTNIVNTCFGGSKEPWVTGNNKICNFGSNAFFIPPAGNFYNPTTTIQPYVKYPYWPNATGDNGINTFPQPFSATFAVQVKL